jgi:ankyrin repeat protein
MELALRMRSSCYLRENYHSSVVAVNRCESITEDYINYRAADQKHILLEAIEKNNLAVCEALLNKKMISEDVIKEAFKESLLEKKFDFANLIAAGDRIAACGTVLKDIKDEEVIQGAFKVFLSEKKFKLAEIITKDRNDKLRESMESGDDTNVLEAIKKADEYTLAYNNNGAIDSILFLAIEKNKVEWVKALVEKNVNINDTNAEKQTALIYALDKGHKEVAELLITKNLILTKKGKDEKTAHDVARDKGFDDLASKLEIKPSKTQEEKQENIEVVSSAGAHITFSIEQITINADQALNIIENNLKKNRTFFFEVLYPPQHNISFNKHEEHEYTQKHDDILKAKAFGVLKAKEKELGQEIRHDRWDRIKNMKLFDTGNRIKLLEEKRNIKAVIKKGR